MMQDDWRSRHPFTLGQQVWVKPWSQHAAIKTGAGLRGLDPATPYVVAMRGESLRGCWITLERVTPYAFSTRDFTAVPPMPACTVDVMQEAA